jgi:hypothetical protein
MAGSTSSRCPSDPDTTGNRPILAGLPDPAIRTFFMAIPYSNTAIVDTATAIHAYIHVANATSLICPKIILDSHQE